MVVLRSPRIPTSRRRWGVATGVVALLLLASVDARADEPDASPGTPAVAPDTAPTSPAADAAAPSEIEKLRAELAEQKKELADQRKELEEQKQSLEESKKTVEDVSAKVDEGAASDSDWTSRFKIYGFTDVGLNRLWINEKAEVASVLNSANATSFVVGNLNLYFDAQPVKNWRSLVEIRFTNAPHGEILSYGGLGGTFKRNSTMQVDPNAGSAYAQMWGGYTVIERAHLDWTALQLLKVRVGNFFTPFGIWNVDHGSPTLIAVQLPGIIQLRQMPLRQTGIQVYGSTFAGDWELGYTATVSNGRQELSNFAFDDNRGFGGRIYANNEKGDVSMKFGASFYTGRVRDQQVDITSVAPVLEISRKSTYDYREIVGGVDASVDVGHLRLRAEGAMSSVEFDDGLHQKSPTSNTAYLPNSVTYTGYFLAAYQLPFAPIEPFATFDVFHSDLNGGVLGDMTMIPGGGFNVRFSKAVIWKNQLSRAFFMRADESAPGAPDPGRNNTTSLFSRLVLVF